MGQDRAAISVPGLPAAEETGFQIRQGIVRLPRLQYLHPAGRAAVRRQTDEALTGADALRKDLQTAAISQQGHGDGF